MGGFNRLMVSADGRLPQPSRVGDGMLSHFKVYNHVGDANFTATVEILSGGHITQDTALTAARTITTDTAALIAAAWPEMDIGDSYSFVVSNSQAGAFNLVVAGGAGVTLQTVVGNVVPGSSRVFTLVKTAAATFDLY